MTRARAFFPLLGPLQHLGAGALTPGTVLLLCLGGCGGGGEEANAGSGGASGVTGGAPGSGGDSGIPGGGSGGQAVGTGGSSSSGGASTGGVPGGGGVPGAGGESLGTGGLGEPGGTGGGGDIPPPACEQSATDANKVIAEDAMRRLFIETDASAFTEYWADPYLQHNPIAGSGVDAFWGFFEGQVAAGNPLYTMERSIGECDLVLFHGSWGTGAMFDMLRVDSGKLVEHWDAPSSGLGGMTTTGDPALSGASKQVALAFLDELIANDPNSASAYLGASFVSHNADLGGSGAEFVTWWEERSVTYAKVHHVIADGELVFTMTEGAMAGQGYGFYDLFRVVNGAITEHWDGGRAMEAGVSGLGIF